MNKLHKSLLIVLAIAVSTFIASRFSFFKKLIPFASKGETKETKETKKEYNSFEKALGEAFSKVFEMGFFKGSAAKSTTDLTNMVKAKFRGGAGAVFVYFEIDAEVTKWLLKDLEGKESFNISSEDFLKEHPGLEEEFNKAVALTNNDAIVKLISEYSLGVISEEDFSAKVASLADEMLQGKAPQAEPSAELKEGEIETDFQANVEKVQEKSKLSLSVVLSHFEFSNEIQEKLVDLFLELNAPTAEEWAKEIKNHPEVSDSLTMFYIFVKKDEVKNLRIQLMAESINEEEFRNQINSLIEAYYKECMEERKMSRREKAKHRSQVKPPVKDLKDLKQAVEGDEAK